MFDDTVIVMVFVAVLAMPLILDWIKNYRSKLAADRKQCAYDSGYNWAAGQLISGKTFEEVESFSVPGRCYGDFGEFDLGLAAAVADFRKLTSVSEPWGRVERCHKDHHDRLRETFTSTNFCSICGERL